MFKGVFMFHSIPSVILERMSYLEGLDKAQRSGKIDLKRVAKLCQIPPETGRFISLMAASAPRGQWLELGTSAGYSALWLSLACKQLHKKLTTFEGAEQHIALAKETFLCTKLSEYIELVAGNLFEFLPSYNDISFCFLDTSNEIYADCYDIVIPNMRPGGILLADNAISHQTELQFVIDRALEDTRVDSMVVPIGKGVLMCRKKE